MQNLFKNKVLSIVLTIALIAGILGGAAVLFDGSSNGATSGSSNPGSNSNSGNSAGVVDFSELTYVAFGDSITFGWDGGTISRMAKPYPTCVAEVLNFQEYLNCAVNGSTITQIEGLTNVNTQVANASAEFDIVSVMIGVNDYARSAELGTLSDTGLTTVYGGLNTLVGNLKAKYPDAFIFFMTPLPCYREEVNNYASGVPLEDVVSAVKQVCYRNSIPVLDMYSLGEFTIENDPYTDGCHPTQSYMIRYAAPKIAAFIKSNYK